jgi:XapX domain-containing protein
MTWNCGGVVVIKGAAGIALGLLIGAGCRWLDVPVPAPPKFIGAVLVVAMTVGYLGADKLLSHRVTVAATMSSASAGSLAPPKN